MKLPIPPINWDRVLMIVVSLLIVLFALAIVTKMRVVMAMFDGLLLISVLSLLVLGAVALVKKLTQPKV